MEDGANDDVAADHDRAWWTMEGGWWMMDDGWWMVDDGWWMKIRDGVRR